MTWTPGAEGAVANVARQILDWAGQHGLHVWFGYGQKDGSFQAGLDDPAGKFFPFAIYGYGRVEIQFQFIRRPPFNAPQQRGELQHRLNAIPGVKIPNDALAKRPSFPLDALADETALQVFLAAMDWSFDQARAAIPPMAPSSQTTL